MIAPTIKTIDRRINLKLRINPVGTGVPDGPKRNEFDVIKWLHLYGIYVDMSKAKILTSRTVGDAGPYNSIDQRINLRLRIILVGARNCKQLCSPAHGFTHQFEI